jgi:hypothetical protein
VAADPDGGANAETTVNPGPAEFSTPDVNNLKGGRKPKPDRQLPPKGERKAKAPAPTTAGKSTRSTPRKVVGLPSVTRIDVD